MADERNISGKKQLTLKSVSPPPFRNVGSSDKIGDVCSPILELRENIGERWRENKNESIVTNDGESGNLAKSFEETKTIGQNGRQFNENNKKEQPRMPELRPEHLREENQEEERITNDEGDGENCDFIVLKTTVVDDISENTIEASNTASKDMYNDKSKLPSKEEKADLEVNVFNQKKSEFAKDKLVAKGMSSESARPEELPSFGTDGNLDEEDEDDLRSQIARMEMCKPTRR